MFSRGRYRAVVLWADVVCLLWTKLFVCFSISHFISNTVFYNNVQDRSEGIIFGGVYRSKFSNWLWRQLNIKHLQNRWTTGGPRVGMKFVLGDVGVRNLRGWGRHENLFQGWREKDILRGCMCDKRWGMGRHAWTLFHPKSLPLIWWFVCRLRFYFADWGLILPTEVPFCRLRLDLPMRIDMAQ